MLRRNGIRTAQQACRWQVLSQRFYAAPKTESATGATPSDKEKKSRFDKSVLKPLGLLVVFGSILTNVMEERRKFNNMERRYELKINKLEELLERCKKGERDVDIDNELKIIEAMFAVSENQNIAGLIAKRKQEYDSDIKQVESKENESLQSLWADIMKSVDDIPEDSKKNKSTTMDLVTDPDILEKRKAEEDLVRKTAPSYMTHTIVETPGEVSEAAKDTSIKKFL